MPHDHAVLPRARSCRLLEFSVRRLDGDDVADVIFEDPTGLSVKVMFLGVKDLKVAHFVAHETGYAIVDQRDTAKPDRAVKLVPPKRGGLSLAARAVMSVDLV